MKHIHADVIHAYADGAKIEARQFNHDPWTLSTSPCFHSNWQYRVKPTPNTYRLWRSTGGSIVMWISEYGDTQHKAEQLPYFDRWVTTELEYDL